MSEPQRNTEATELNESALHEVTGGVGAADAGQKKRANGTAYLTSQRLEASRGPTGEYIPIPGEK